MSPAPQTPAAPVAASPWASHPGFLESDEIAPEPGPSAPVPPAPVAPLTQEYVVAGESSAPNYEPAEAGRRFSILRFLTSNAVLAGGMLAAIIFSRSVGDGDAGRPFPTGVVVGASVLGLAAIAMIRRIATRREEGSMAFPFMVAGLALVCSVHAHKHYKVERNQYQRAQDRSEAYTEYAEPSRASEQKVQTGERFTTDRRMTPPVGTWLDEKRAREPQRWWPESRLRELDVNAPERAWLVAAANAVLDVSPRFSEKGATRVDAPTCQSTLLDSLTEADVRLFRPSHGKFVQHYVRMWPNTFRVLYYSTPGGAWSAAVQVTVTPEGKVEHEFFSLEPVSSSRAAR